MASSDVLPRFYTPFISHFSSKSFMIPSSYYEYLPRQLPKTAILLGICGRFWKVEMKKIRGQIYFHRGWEKFVEDNDLRDGEFLTFVFDGYRSYEVSIFGHGGCKETRESVEVQEISDGTEIENIDTSLDSLDITNIIDEVMNCETEIDSDIVAVQAEASNKRRKVRSRVKNTINNPQAYLDDPQNIYFVTSLKNRKYELLFDTRVVKDYKLKFGTSLEYIDEIGILTGKLATWMDRRICVKKWNVICDRNKVTKNDGIVCEILRSGSMVRGLKIHIIRGEARN